MKNISLVVFDMAGTTVQDEGLVADSFLAADEAVGLSRSPDEREMMMRYTHNTMGQSKIEVFRSLARENESLAQAANNAFEQAYVSKVREGKIAPMPGAENILRSLRESSIKIALTTGFSQVTQSAIIDTLGWRDIADVILCPGSGIRSRPYPDMPLTALLRTHTNSVTSMVVVGDTVSDIASGRAAGAPHTIGVLSGAHSRRQLTDAGATGILSSVAELVHYLDNVTEDT